LVRLLNWFNRAIVVIVLLALVVGGLLVSLLPGLVAGWLRALAGLLDTAAFMTVAVVGIPIALIALLLLVLELRMRRPGAVALAGDSGARLSTETIVQRLRTDVGAVADVDQVRPTVWPRRGKVDVELAVTTAPAVDVPTKAAEVSEVARATIDKLGLKLGKLSVNLSHTGRGWPVGKGPDSGPSQPAIAGPESST
jgi:hypothetical protein